MADDDPDRLVSEVEAHIAAGTLQIIIDEDGNVTFSDLPADLQDLVRELTDDPALLSRFCSLPSPPDKVR
jgi:hypothetical protein